MTKADVIPIEYEKAAERLGVSVAAIRAIAEVESNGDGFLSDGRPKILFERHVFYRLLLKIGKDASGLSTNYPDIVNSKAGGYKGGAAEWRRFEQAQTIDRDLAIESASWGSFQIMGYHWRSLGYVSACDFQASMAADRAAQLQAFVSFIANDARLAKYLRALDWPGFARAYNGPDYARNRYDEKMAAAYRRFVAKDA